MNIIFNITKMNICIIKPNQFNLSELPKINENPKNNYDEEPFNKTDYKKKMKYANIEEFKKIIKNYVEIRTIELNDLPNIIDKELNITDNWANVTEDLYESRDYLYQMCFVDKHHKECKIEESNYIASILTNEKKAIVGTTVILKEHIPENNSEIELCNILYEDLYFLLVNDKIHAGVLIGMNGKLTQIYYNNKLKLVNLDKHNTYNNLEYNCLDDINYEGYKHTILKFDFNIYVRKSDTYDKEDINFNHIASKLYQMKIEGDSIFIGKDVETEKYYDIFVEDIADLLRIEPNKLKLDKKDKDDITKKIYNSKYRIIYNRINK